MNFQTPCGILVMRLPLILMGDVSLKTLLMIGENVSLSGKLDNFEHFAAHTILYWNETGCNPNIFTE